MRCPHCHTENRDDRASCYHCGKDLALVRLLTARARAHYNTATEHVERQRYHEALGELSQALSLNAQLAEALSLKAVCLSKLQRTAEAAQAFEAVIGLNPLARRAARQLRSLKEFRTLGPARKRFRALLRWSSLAAFAAVVAITAVLWVTATAARQASAERRAWSALQAGDLAESRYFASKLPPGARSGELLRATGTVIAMRISEAQSLAAAGKLPESVRAFDALLAERLPADLQVLAEQQRANLLLAAMNALEASMGAFPATAADRAAMEFRATQIIATFPAAEIRVLELQAARARAITAAAKELLASAEALMEQSPRAPGLAVLDKTIADLADELGPDSTTAVRLTRMRYRRAEATAAAALAAVQARDEKTFADIIEDLKAQPRVPEDVLSRAAALGEVLETERRARRTTALESARAAGDWRAVVGLANGVAGLSLEEAAFAADARAQVALLGYYDALAALDGLAEGEVFTPDVARRVLAWVAEARHGLPPRLASRGAENLHYAAHLAHSALNQRSDAGRELTALRREFPASAWVRE